MWKLPKLLMILITILVCIGCAEDEKSDAVDYFPFAVQDHVIHWTRSTTIRILLPADSDVTITNYRSELRDAFMEGAAVWESVLKKLDITIEYVTSGENEVSVVWSEGSGTLLGFATFDTSQDPSRKIVMVTDFDGEAISTALTKSTATHEMGHILGIWNHSFDRADIMYPTEQGTSTLSGRDKATLEYAYTFSPDLDLSNLPANSGDLSNAFDFVLDLLKPVFVKEEDITQIFIFCTANDVDHPHHPPFNLLNAESISR